MNTTDHRKSETTVSRNKDQALSSPPAKVWSLVCIIWLCFVLRGIFYSSILPLWEGYDEYSHFAFLQHAVAHGDLPRPGETRISRQVQESMRLVGLPWLLRDLPTDQYLTHDQYWKLSAEERARRERKLKSLPSAWRGEFATHKLLLYEGQQPPLYYWLLSAPLRILWLAQLPTQVIAIRWLSVGLCSLVVPIGFLLVRHVLRQEHLSLTVVAFAASMPEFILETSRVSNESLAVVLYTSLVYTMVRFVDRPCAPARACFLGLGL